MNTRRNRTLTPWINDFLTKRRRASKRFSKIVVVSCDKGRTRSGGIIKEIEDGAVYIKAVFTKSAVTKALGEKTPLEEWRTAMLLVRDVELEVHNNGPDKESYEFVLVVNEFVVWDYLAGLHAKNTIHWCMNSSEVQQAAVDFVKEMEQKAIDTECESADHSITALLQEMAEASLECDTHITTSSDRKYSVTEWNALLTKPFTVDDLLIPSQLGTDASEDYDNQKIPTLEDDCIASLDREVSQQKRKRVSWGNTQSEVSAWQDCLDSVQFSGDESLCLDSVQFSGDESLDMGSPDAQSTQIDKVTMDCTGDHNNSQSVLKEQAKTGKSNRPAATNGEGNVLTDSSAYDKEISQSSDLEIVEKEQSVIVISSGSADSVSLLNQRQLVRKSAEHVTMYELEELSRLEALTVSNPSSTSEFSQSTLYKKSFLFDPALNSNPGDSAQVDRRNVNKGSEELFDSTPSLTRDKNTNESIDKQNEPLQNESVNSSGGIVSPSPEGVSKRKSAISISIRGNVPGDCLMTINTTDELTETSHDAPPDKDKGSQNQETSSQINSKRKEKSDGMLKTILNNLVEKYRKTTHKTVVCSSIEKVQSSPKQQTNILRSSQGSDESSLRHSASDSDKSIMLKYYMCPAESQESCVSSATRKSIKEGSGKGDPLSCDVDTSVSVGECRNSNPKDKQTLDDLQDTQASITIDDSSPETVNKISECDPTLVDVLIDTDSLSLHTSYDLTASDKQTDSGSNQNSILKHELMKALGLSSQQALHNQKTSPVRKLTQGSFVWKQVSPKKVYPEKLVVRKQTSHSSPSPAYRSQINHKNTSKVTDQPPASNTKRATNKQITSPLISVQTEISKILQRQNRVTDMMFRGKVVALTPKGSESKLLGKSTSTRPGRDTHNSPKSANGKSSFKPLEGTSEDIQRPCVNKQRLLCRNRETCNRKTVQLDKTCSSNTSIQTDSCLDITLEDLIKPCSVVLNRLDERKLRNIGSKSRKCQNSNEDVSHPGKSTVDNRDQIVHTSKGHTNQIEIGSQRNLDKSPLDQDRTTGLVENFSAVRTSNKDNEMQRKENDKVTKIRASDEMKGTKKDHYDGSQLNIDPNNLSNEDLSMTQVHFQESQGFDPVLSPDDHLQTPQNMPVNHSNKAVNNSNMPVNNSNMPVNGSNMTGNNSNMTGNNSNMPVNNSNMAVNNSNMPVNSSNERVIDLQRTNDGCLSSCTRMSCICENCNEDNNGCVDEESVYSDNTQCDASCQSLIPNINQKVDRLNSIERIKNKWTKQARTVGLNIKLFTRTNTRNGVTYTSYVANESLNACFTTTDNDQEMQDNADNGMLGASKRKQMDAPQVSEREADGANIRSQLKRARLLSESPDEIREMSQPKMARLTSVSPDVIRETPQVKRSRLNTESPGAASERTPVKRSSINTESPGAVSERSPVKRSRLNTESPGAVSERSPVKRSRLNTESPGAVSERSPVKSSSINTESPGAVSERSPVKSSRLNTESPGAVSERSPVKRSSINTESLGAVSERSPVKRSRLNTESLGAVSERTPVKRSSINTESPGAVSERTPVKRSRLNTESPGAVSERTPVKRSRLNTESPGAVRERSPVKRSRLNTEGYAELDYLLGKLPLTKAPSSANSAGRRLTIEDMFITMFPVLKPLDISQYRFTPVNRHRKEDRLSKSGIFGLKFKGFKPTKSKDVNSPPNLRVRRSQLTKSGLAALRREVVDKETAIQEWLKTSNAQQVDSFED